MPKRLALVCALAACSLAGCASAPDHLFNRPHATAEALVDDVSACAKIANDVHARAAYVYSDPKAGLAAQGGSAFGAGLAQGMAETRLHNQAIDGCMVARGWAPAPLSPEERGRFGATPATSEARKGFISQWMAAHPIEGEGSATKPAAPSA